jgi:hypothetical protein
LSYLPTVEIDLKFATLGDLNAGGELVFIHQFGQSPDTATFTAWGSSFKREAMSVGACIQSTSGYGRSLLRTILTPGKTTGE